MAKRQGISATARWQVFARDNFRCRYCGAQAGTDGIALQVEHVVSVIDGGTNAMDNLVAACQRCNNGKHARSLDEVPGSTAAVEHATRHAVSMAEQARALAAERDAQAAVRQEMVNLLCQAYAQKSVYISDTNIKQLIGIGQTYGNDTLASWIMAAASRRIRVSQCTRYIFGIIRRNREQRDEAAG